MNLISTINRYKIKENGKDVNYDFEEKGLYIKISSFFIN